MVVELVVVLVQVELGPALVQDLGGFVFERLQFCPQIAGCAGSALVKLDFLLLFILPSGGKTSSSG